MSDLEDRLRLLDALDIPTRYPDSLPEGAPSDHFGLCSWPLELLPLSCDALVLTPPELEQLFGSSSRMAQELQTDLRWLDSTEDGCC